MTAETTGIEDADGIEDAVFGYQWVRVTDRDRQDPDSATDIAGADTDTATYEVQTEDLGKSLRVRVTFVDDLEYEEEVMSEATAEIQAAADWENNAPTGLPTIGGAARAGETLTADSPTRTVWTTRPSPTSGSGTTPT